MKRFNISKRKIRLTLSVLFILPAFVFAQEKEQKTPLEQTVSALKFRSIGPAHASGRIADIEVNPDNHSEYYLAVAAGNVWKTENAGISFKPIFDNYGSYSTADVAINPNNTNEVWVGTGEYNSQRAIGYGDGVYLSRDGGKSFENVGLKKSEHIGRIVIDPRNSDVYVAAQGPLWGPGGERGLYKTSDKGETWDKILDISENTGITDIVYDPRNPDILYAASYQRRRRVFTLINGGPESAIYKSADAGKSWRKLKSGLPSSDMGRIGLAVSPANPDYVYAIIEAAEGKSGIYKSTDRGESWTKQSDYISTSPQYYNRIIPDPKDPEKLYSLDTYTKYTLDGGKTWSNLGIKYKHVDDHALWINPEDTRHLIIGGDGGIYETFDAGSNWRHVPNLPVTQYYRVSIDNSKPFYNICGGTQDNNSMTGPSQTISKYGILNSDWKTTLGGDGFFSAFDPENPDIIYTEYQYGGLARYDKRSGEKLYIQPQPPKGEAYRWNWNAPMLISKHKSTRLYFAANKVFRSEDRGNSWKVISPDLTRELNRNELKVMGKIQSPEAVSKNASTSIFGNIVSFSESPVNENLLYAGTDDGLIQVSDDGGKKWKSYQRFGDVPEMTYVSCLLASQHDENTVYASFDGRKNSDLKPHIYKSTDKGKSWTKITGNLPENGTVHSIAEDYKKPNLIFAGTEFGIFVSDTGGEKWQQIKNGIPTIAVRDIKIKEGEDDLVLATFGRGFYILDDYSPLRNCSEELFAKDAHIFPIKDALMYVRTSVKYGQGASYFAGENPEYGAVFTVYLKNDYKTRKQERKEAEKMAKEAGEDITYPTFEELRKEDRERKPYLILTIRNEDGRAVRRIKTGANKGVKRVNWALRGFNQNLVNEEKSASHDNADSGYPVVPGKYSVSLSVFHRGKEMQLTEPVYFNTVPLNNASLATDDRQALADFQKEASKVNGAVQATRAYLNDLEKQAGALRTALINAPASVPRDIEQADEYLQNISDLKSRLDGDKSISKRHGSQPPSIASRVSRSVYGIWNSTSAPTETLKTNLAVGKQELKTLISEIKSLESGIKRLHETARKAGAPPATGKLPELD